LIRRCRHADRGGHTRARIAPVVRVIWSPRPGWTSASAVDSTRIDRDRSARAIEAAGAAWERAGVEKLIAGVNRDEKQDQFDPNSIKCGLIYVWRRHKTPSHAAADSKSAPAGQTAGPCPFEKIQRGSGSNSLRASQPQLGANQDGIEAKSIDLGGVPPSGLVAASFRPIVERTDPSVACERGRVGGNDRATRLGFWHAMWQHSGFV